MKKTLAIFFFVLMIPAAHAAQDQKQDQPVATPADILKAQQAAHRDAAAIKTQIMAGETAAETNRSAEKTEHQNLVGAVSDAQRQIITATQTQGDISKTEGEKTRQTVLFGAALISVVVVLGGTFLVLWTRKGRNTKMKSVAITPSAKTEVESFTLPDDPTPAEIEKLFAAGAESVKITVLLPARNTLVSGGVVRKDSHGKLVIEFPGGMTRSLEIRRKAAEEYFRSLAGSSDREKSQLVS